MKLLVKKKDFEVYMDVIDAWIDPILIMKEGKKQEKMTVSSGELELPLGKFVINENLIKDLKRIDIMLTEIADPDSIEKISEKRKIFKLKDEYLKKAKEIYHEQIN